MTSEGVILIIQSRMGSKRLPGKSTLDLAGKPLLSRILERVKRCKTFDEIVLAIPKGNKDDILENQGKLNNIKRKCIEEPLPHSSSYTRVAFRNPNTVGIPNT